MLQAVKTHHFGILRDTGLNNAASSSAGTLIWNVMRHDRRLHKLLVAQFAIALVFLQTFSTFGLHVTSCGFSAATYGLLISLNGVMIVFLELPLTTFTRRWPACPTIAAGYLLIGFGFALTGWAASIPMLALVVVAFTLGEMIAMPVVSAYVAESIPPEMRGRYMGAFGLVWALGLMFGPGTGVQLHAHAPLLLWGACGALGVIAAAMVMSTRKVER